MHIAVEGLIGCGKSSVLLKLKELVPCNVKLEPVEEWKELLERFCQDQQRWALPFQMKVLLGFLQEKLPVVSERLTLVERSAESCRNVFGKLLLETGKMDPCEWDVFEQCFATLGVRSPPLSILIDVPVEECLRRTQQRGRQGKEKLAEAYMVALDNQYRKFIRHDSKSARAAGQPLWLGESDYYENVLVIDGLMPLSEVAAYARLAIRVFQACTIAT
jgi:deoxyadenosine/deoxycytidine kinase